MVSHRQLFLSNVAQTSDFPMMLEIEKAEGVYIHDYSGKKYLDLIAGISVSNLGHRHPVVVKAVKDQLDKYMHLMVYGEYVQAPQVKLASLIAESLPAPLDNCFFVNSGSEAVEGGLKLAKRYTGRQGIIAFKKAYHGSTHGSLSLISDPGYTGSFKPLLEGVTLLDFNQTAQLKAITNDTACVIVEVIQGEAGIQVAEKDFLTALREKCSKHGALLIFDEIQTGFGRTGKMFAFEHYGVVPDVILFAKGMGGGMPIGAFVSSREIMSVLKNNPVLGHITTFGGHPVSCASAHATLQFLANNQSLVESCEEKSRHFISHLNTKHVQEVRGKGLFLALQLESNKVLHEVISRAVDKGLVIDWFLFRDDSIRVAPPLVIDHQELAYAAQTLNEAMEDVLG